VGSEQRAKRKEKREKRKEKRAEALMETRRLGKGEE
jgi:hypothetical protein